MPHPRPSGDSEGLSTLLRSGTSAVHKEAEARPFMQAFFAGRLPRHAYIGWLARQWHLYRTLEAGLDSLPSAAPEHGLVPVELYRTERIEADLDHLTDGDWRHKDHLSAATRAYVERIEAAGALPTLLIAHAWLRYMGNVGGREVLRRLVATSIGAAEGDERGLAFTDYAAVGEIRPFFADFHAKLDALPLTDDHKLRVVQEADAGFQLNIALTDELAIDHGIAPALLGDGTGPSVHEVS